MDSLAISERQELQRHEQIIQQGLNTFVEVGQAGKRAGLAFGGW